MNSTYLIEYEYGKVNKPKMTHFLSPKRHYPKQTFTIVTDTPENLRLRQQSELQSQVRSLVVHCSIL